MEQDSTKNRLALVKTNRVSKYMLWIPNPNQYQNIENKEK